MRERDRHPLRDPAEDDVGDAHPFDEQSVPIDEESEEPVAPRRAASAEFVVDTTVGSHAQLREAMDPANESLAEALRLSFRVLQVVILVLVVLFVFSGFQTVEEGQSGVLLRWGKILDVDGKQALEPGLKFSRWPYPAGEFVLFDEKDRTVDLGNMYWQQIKEGQSLAEAIQAASVHQRLRPGRDGSVLTRGGDIAHIRLRGRYDIDAPARFVYVVEDVNGDESRLDADRLVEFALQRAVVHSAAQRTLQNFVDMADGGKDEIRDNAQRLLDAVDSGIRLVSVETPLEPTPAFAIRKSFGDLQEARIVAEERIKDARKDAATRLTEVAGKNYSRLVNLISEYEDAHELGQEDAAEALLDQINVALEDETTTGQVNSMIARAKSYRETIDNTLGLEASRFASVREQFRKQPRWIVSKLWTDAYNSVFQRADTEIIRTPADGSVLNISLAGLDHIREERRKGKLNRQRDEAYGRNLGFDLQNPYIPRAREMQEGPGRQLDEQGRSLQNR